MKSNHCYFLKTPSVKSYKNKHKNDINFTHALFFLRVLT